MRVKAMGPVLRIVNNPTKAGWLKLYLLDQFILINHERKELKVCAHELEVLPRGESVNKFFNRLKPNDWIIVEGEVMPEKYRWTVYATSIHIYRYHGLRHVILEMHHLALVDKGYCVIEDYINKTRTLAEEDAITPPLG